MRIALFTETYEPYINGVVTHIRALKNGLEKLGHDVLIVCANPNTRHYFVKDNVLNCPSVSVKKIYEYGIATPISPIRFKYIKKFNPDVIHIHTEFGVGYSGAAASRLLNVPLVYTMHTMYDDYLYYIVPKRLINIAKKTSHMYAKMLANKATCLTGPSKKVQHFFDSCGVKKNVYIIPNPVEVDLFKPDCTSQEKKDKIRKSLNVSENDLLLCFCGRLGREKNVDLLIQYWNEKLSGTNSKLLIIGDGPCKTDLEELVISFGLSSQIKFVGKIAHEDLPPYYDSCDLYITASLSDTNSISMLEAMASGKPVVHIKDELNKGQVIDGVNGFIYNNACELSAILDKYKSLSVEEKNKLSKTARDSVEKKGSLTLAQNLLKVYKTAINIKNQ